MIFREDLFLYNWLQVVPVAGSVVPQEGRDVALQEQVAPAEDIIDGEPSECEEEQQRKRAKLLDHVDLQHEAGMMHFSCSTVASSTIVA